MKKLHTPEVDTLFRGILTLQSIEECYAFFEDVCTAKELLDIAQRLRAAKMLQSGENYLEVSRVTGMSTATISRVNKCLTYGEGGYDMVLSRLAETEESEE